MSLQSIKKFILRILFPKKFEENFYTELFTKNKFWSSPKPNNDEQKRWHAIEHLIRNIEFDTDRQLEILDLGCGRGWLSSLLSNYGRVTGLEPVQNVVAYAKQLFPEVSFVHGDLSTFASLNHQYDLIVSSEVLEHIPNNKKSSFFIDVKALMKPDAYCIISTPRAEILNHAKKASNQPIEEWITENELKNLAERAGLIALEKRTVDLVYLDKEEEVYQVWLFQ